jgi:hypothetical protein
MPDAFYLWRASINRTSIDRICMATPLKKQARPLNIREEKALKKIRSSQEKEIHQAFKPQVLAALALAGIVAVITASRTTYKLAIFLLGLVGLICFASLVLMPFEVYKTKRKAGAKIKLIDDLLARNAVDVYTIRAKQVALARQYGNEGELFIVDTVDHGILYLWDHDGSLRKNFPCLEFEVYDEPFQELIGRQVNPLGAKTKPNVVIDAKAKQAYFKKAAPPGHMTTDRKLFENVIARMIAAGEKLRTPVTRSTPKHKGTR